MPTLRTSISTDLGLELRQSGSRGLSLNHCLMSPGASDTIYLVEFASEATSSIQSS